jgi:predicted small metal-binding protein
MLTIECDCGYVCRAPHEDELVEGAQRHARDAHGIDVTREQILAAASRAASGWRARNASEAIAHRRGQA